MCIGKPNTGRLWRSRHVSGGPIQDSSRGLPCFVSGDPTQTKASALSDRLHFEIDRAESVNPHVTMLWSWTVRERLPPLAFVCVGSPDTKHGSPSALPSCIGPLDTRRLLHDLTVLGFPIHMRFLDVNSKVINDLVAVDPPVCFSLVLCGFKTNSGGVVPSSVSRSYAMDSLATTVFGYTVEVS